MKFEPPVDRNGLLATICEEYGIPAVELAFVPLGFEAACYAVWCAGGQRYFLKLWTATRAGSASASRRETSLRLAQALHERHIVPRVPYPIPTRGGALSATFQASPFALFPFLAGHSAPALADMPPSLRDELARTLARLHRATPALVDVLPPRETFDLLFEMDLQTGLAAVDDLGPQARPGQVRIREVILPCRPEIQEQLGRLHRLQEAARQHTGPFVLVHGDLGGDNLLVDDQGQVSVLDWDWAVVAPAEHDLHWTLGAAFPRFLEVYEDVAGPQAWQLEQFAFWLLRRSLDDFTGDLLHLLDASGSASEDAYYLDHLERWGFARWRALDETVEEIARALRASRF